jgi:hypothetical protein
VASPDAETPMPAILCPLCGKRARLAESAREPATPGVPRRYAVAASYDCDGGRHTVEVVVRPRRPPVPRRPPPLPPSGAAA